jgi:hypothetical protein
MFDETEKPPVWIGMLASNVPLITVFVNYTPWIRGTASIELTKAAFDQVMAAPPCIAICTYPREDGHHTTECLVIPS